MDIEGKQSIDEHQFYLQRVGFCVAHTLTWCKQLNAANELLTNFDYSKKLGPSRADHLIYNIENYLIRLNSVYDRVLHLINAVFHLGINEEHVFHGNVISNYKVQHKPDVVSHTKAIKKYLDKYSQIRHTLIHKNSLMDDKLNRIELFYLDDFKGAGWSDAKVRKLKIFRANYLREYIVERKSEFSVINAELASLMNALFETLHKEYLHQRKVFQLCGL